MNIVPILLGLNLDGRKEGMWMAVDTKRQMVSEGGFTYTTFLLKFSIF
jgi:hypothetical protein